MAPVWPDARTAPAWLIALGLLAALTGCVTPTEAPAMAAAVAVATPSVNRQGLRATRWWSRNRDSDEGKRGNKMSLRSGAGERSAVTQGAASRWQCTGLRQGRM
jgi:hypothetical protein